MMTTCKSQLYYKFFPSSVSTLHEYSINIITFKCSNGNFVIPLNFLKFSPVLYLKASAFALSALNSTMSS